MVPLKLLVAATLIASVAAFTRSEADEFSNDIRDLFVGFKNDPYVDKSAIDELSNISNPSKYYNIFWTFLDFAVTASAALRGILNGWVFRLGTILEKTVVCVIKGDMCINYGGKTKDFFGVCYESVEEKYTGNATRPAQYDYEDHINKWGLKLPVNDVRELIQRHVGDIDKLTGSQKVVAKACVALSDLVSLEHFANEDGDSVLDDLYEQLTIILGAIGNSHTTGFGDKIAKLLVPQFCEQLDASGPQIDPDAPPEVYLARVLKAIEPCSNDGDPWLTPTSGGPPELSRNPDFTDKELGFGRT